MNLNKHGYVGVTFASLFFLSACSGGSSTSVADVQDTLGVDTPSVDTTPVDTNPTVAAPVTGSAGGDTDLDLETGRFVDSAVIGLTYTTDTQSGVTGDDGSFQYVAGETVVFSIGDVVLPEVEGSELVTPLDVFNTSDIGDPRVINLTRLLQTLDVDADPDNGITISDQANASGTGLTLDFASPNFDSEAANLVANSGSTQVILIDGETALDHFQETLFIEGVEERPEAPPAVAETPDATGVDATHPLVGTVREFTTRSHDVSGTVTILDNRTIEVTNFVYDGGGPRVFFYTGTDGNFASGPGAGIIGTELSGRAFDNETIILTLPNNLTLDDFNGLSVWCDIFFVSFGDVMF